MHKSNEYVHYASNCFQPTTYDFFDRNATIPIWSSSIGFNSTDILRSLFLHSLSYFSM